MEAADDANQLDVGCAIRGPAVHPTSWFAVDGSERVGVSPRKTAGLRKIVTTHNIFSDSHHLGLVPVGSQYPKLPNLKFERILFLIATIFHSVHTSSHHVQL